MGIEYCKTCGAYIRAAIPHECPPAWECCDPAQDSDTWTTVHQYDAERAALKYCEDVDDGDAACPTYAKPPWEAHAILVRPAGSTTAQTWMVEAEVVVSYMAREAVRG